MTVAQFRQGVRRCEIVQVGLLELEAMFLLADGLGFDLVRATEKVTPVLSKRRVKTPYLTVKSDQVAMLIAMVPFRQKLEPGLRTMLDASMPHFRSMD